MVVLAGLLYALNVPVSGVTFGCLGVTPIVVTSGLRLCVAVALAGGPSPGGPSPVARHPVARRPVARRPSPVARRPSPDNRNIRNMWKLSSFSLLSGGGGVYL